MKILQTSHSDNLSKEEVRYLGILGLVLVLFVSFVFSGVNKTEASELSYKLSTNDLVLQKEMTDSKIAYFFQNLDVRATAMVVYDTNREDSLFTKNQDQVMPLASLVKIMTSIVALENLDDGEIIQLKKEDLSKIGDNGLLSNEKWDAKELIKFTLITSSNDGAHAIARHVGEKLGGQDDDSSTDIFLNLMNQKAKDMFLENTVFYNESGLDFTPEQNGGYSTAREITKLFSYAVLTYPEIFSSTSFNSQDFKSLNNLDHKALNTNQNTGKVAGISASKTGFTNLSGGNLVVSFNPSNKGLIIATVLGSTFMERFTDIEKLADTTLKVINEVQL